MPANATNQKARHKTDKVDASQEDAIQRRGLCSKEGQTKREDRAHGTMPLEQMYTQQCVQSAQAAYRLHPFGAVCDKLGVESRAIVKPKNNMKRMQIKKSRRTRENIERSGVQEGPRDQTLDSKMLRPDPRQQSQSRT